MKTHKLSANVSIEELVTPTFFKKYGVGARRWINPLIPAIIQTIIRDLEIIHGKTVSVRLNTWPWGGPLKERGLRDRNTKTGSVDSQHKYGNAFDAEFILKKSKKEIPADDVRALVLNQEEKYLNLGLTRIESGEYAPGWFHGDCANTGVHHIQIIAPRKKK